MQNPQITFHGLAHSPKLEADVVERVAWLAKFYPDIVSCRVLIEVPHRHHRNGRHFHVTVELTLPNGPAIVIKHEPSQHSAVKDTATPEHLKKAGVANVHRDAHVAIHEAFNAARRRLQDFARRQRGAVKMHATP